jgi:uncharacterized membrane protein YgcG
MADGEEWTSVGRRGKPRRTQQQQVAHLLSRAAAAESLAAATHSGLHASAAAQLKEQATQLAAAIATDASSASQPPQPQPPPQLLLAPTQANMASAADAPTVESLPGWGYSVSQAEERAWRVVPGGRRRGKARQQALQASSSPDQDAARLADQVRDLVVALAAAPVHTALLAAMRAAGPGLVLLSDSGGDGNGNGNNNSISISSGIDGCNGCTGKGNSSSSCLQGGGDDVSSWDWRCVRELVVYGLGSPEEGRVSRHQVLLCPKPLIVINLSVMEPPCA